MKRIISREAITKIQAIIILVIVLAAGSGVGYWLYLELQPKYEWIEYWIHPHSPWVKLNEEYVKEYNALMEAKGKNIRVRFTSVPEGDFISKYMAAAEAGNAPDLACEYSGRFAPLLFAGYVQPLNYRPLINELLANFTPGSYSSSSYKGKIYGAPAAQLAWTVVVNTKLWSLAGYGPFVPEEERKPWPKYWEDFLDAVKELNQTLRALEVDHPELKDVYAATFDRDHAFRGLKIHLRDIILSHGDHDILTEDMHWNLGGENRSLAEKVFRWYKLLTPVDDAWVAFANNKSAACYTGSWFLAWITKNGVPGLNETILALPPLRSKDYPNDTTLTTTWNYAFWMSSSKANKKMEDEEHSKHVQEFLHWLMTYPQRIKCARIWAPVRYDSMEELLKDPKIAWWNEPFFESMKYSIGTPIHPREMEIWETLTKELQRYLYDQAPLDEVLDNMEKIPAAILGKE